MKSTILMLLSLHFLVKSNSKENCTPILYITKRQCDDNLYKPHVEDDDNEDEKMFINQRFAEL